MAAKRQSLGKGLDALLGITEEVEEITVSGAAQQSRWQR